MDLKIFLQLFGYFLPFLISSSIIFPIKSQVNFVNINYINNNFFIYFSYMNKNNNNFYNTLFIFKNIQTEKFT